MATRIRVNRGADETDEDERDAGGAGLDPVAAAGASVAQGSTGAGGGNNETTTGGPVPFPRLRTVPTTGALGNTEFMRVSGNCVARQGKTKQMTMIFLVP